MTIDVRELCVLVRAGTRLCAIPIEHVVETMRPQPIRAIANAPDFLSGVALIRGAAVPVVDTSAALGETDTTSGGRLVTVRTADRVVALAVDEVVGIRAITRDEFAALPPLLSRTGAELVAALQTLDADLLTVLRTGRLVPGHVWAAIDAGDYR